MPAVDALIDLLFPNGPPKPTGPPPDLPMPSDLREFFTRIGHNTVEVDNRFGFGINQGLLEYSAKRRENLRHVYKADAITIRGGHEQRRPDVRKAEGDWDVVIDDLLILGSDDNGNDLYLEAVGDPDGWAVVADGCRSPVWARHTIAATDYLHGLLSGSLRCPVFTLDSWPRHRFDVAVRHH
ncbi:hypothetical protein HUT17_05270 (plasmid) [Nocardiopsis flavescens]|nr:hypothetical protein HUT17_05270 [Nocardiopsis flavescens]